MNEGAIRVVLLAREGEARDRLGEALRADGVELVAAMDPAGAGEADIVASSPQAIVVALEPAIEGDVDRLDDLLSKPELTVLFEEADLAVRRTGWDAARWQRHLLAKLHRHGDVLPPGTEQDIDLTPSPGRPPAHAEVTDLDTAINALADEAQQRADQVAHDHTFDGIEARYDADGSPFDPVAFEVDGGMVEIEAEELAGIEFEGLSLTIKKEAAQELETAGATESVLKATGETTGGREFGTGGLSLVDDAAHNHAAPQTSQPCFSSAPDMSAR